MSAGLFRYKPLKITQFEICESWLNPSKECLVAQVTYIDKDTQEAIRRTLWTESYTLVNTIKGTEDSLPHYTKIVVKKDGYYYFVRLNEKEKQLLLNV